MYESAIPDMWRAANISPLYKGKAKRRAPDSILSAPYKFLERFVCCQIQSFWLGNNIICNEQHGIRPCRSTATNECDAIISNILNSVHSCDVLNQIKSNKKAFDKVSQTNLVYKPSLMRLGNSVADWVSNFLQNRSQAIVYKRAHSDLSEVKSGAIEDSVIGWLKVIRSDYLELATN